MLFRSSSSGQAFLYVGGAAGFASMPIGFPTPPGTLGRHGEVVATVDVNGDGLLTPGDFNAWVLAYNTGLPSADQNGDGQVNPNDFNAWVLNFQDGCRD